jgi:hypothetical protein
MQDLDPSQYGEAEQGGRRRAGRLLVREKHCRSWLSKIIWAKPSSSGTLPLTPTRGGHTVELSFAHREHGSRFVIWYFVDDREPGKQICRRRSLI